jgi:hypothetical protein
METTVQHHINPLINFMRQPKIYIRLPSKGEYWPQGALIPTESGEYPIFSMTARDELMLKVPDALMNGQAVVDVIQNCMPNVKNAWAIPAIDLDVILIAIRIATYGEKMSTPLTFGNEIEMEYKVDLRSVMDNLMNQITWESIVPINSDLTVYVKPITYKQMTESAIQTFETQKLMQVANDDSMSDENKVKIFKESFSKLTAVTIGMIGSSIYKVDSSQGSTDNIKFIKEFIDNADKDIFNKVQDHLEKLKEINSIKPIVIQVTEEMKAAGVTDDTIEVPLVFDASTFFE